VSLHANLLIVDDDDEMREALKSLFALDGYGCELAADAASALELVDRRAFDAVVSDIRMEGMDGLELLDRIKLCQPALPVVVLTAVGSVEQAVDAMRRGAFGYAVKPLDVAALQATVASALEERQRAHERRTTSEPVPAGDFHLVGTGPAMQRLRTAIAFVARSSASVLLTGETGAGKELVARAIHEAGPRRDSAFVAVNTAAIPDELIEGEIFGHVRGAFTGALQARKGLLTEADGGTLLLDEIGDMPFSLQAKLLRVLQFGDVRPVGSDRVHRVDVRVIASTHRDLPTLVREGRFREDLYFRLHVLPIRVPSLRERREDIPALAAHFLSSALRRTPESPVRTLGSGALRALCAREWPGNVRELASAIERAVVFGVDETITVNQVRDALGAETGLAWPFGSGTPWTLQRMSRVYAEWVLEQTGGQKQRAAEILGIDQSTLYRWRQKDSD
jgi:two-component system response regulator HydG